MYLLNDNLCYNTFDKLDEISLSVYIKQSFARGNLRKFSNFFFEIHQKR